MNENLEEKPSILPFISFPIAIFLVYLLVFMFLRVNGDIIHWKDQIHHVETLMPDGHELYKEAIVNAINPEESQIELEAKIRYHKKKKQYLDAIFFPLMKGEEWIHELFS